MKTCIKCKTSLELGSFTKDKSRKDGLCPYCKSCFKLITTESQLRDKIQDPTTGKTVYHRRVHTNGIPINSPDYMRNITLKKLYGITIEEYRIMLDKQDNRCIICSKHVKDLVKPLAVDHEHDTGKIRGLLCVKCNIGIGCFQDDPELLLKAKEYLIK